MSIKRLLSIADKPAGTAEARFIIIYWSNSFSQEIGASLGDPPTLDSATGDGYSGDEKWRALATLVSGLHLLFSLDPRNNL